MSDAEGDSTMRSSPDLAPADEMFPDEKDGPSTPQGSAAIASSLDPASEMSPPDSQGPTNLVGVPRDDNLATMTGSPSTINANGKRVFTEGVKVDQATGYTWERQEDEPGYEWMNKRAQEEMVRALDQIVDKGSMIKLRYGDPLDPTIPLKRR
ncbi:hypothetical protein GQ43DRAFT_464407 [Delitschia confertaspora ATCC 74209]|uniref:Uncharacterized protein n=1 Tax=Delitschia confertaspora ATCC 74209 TaxID=1513339 RepID=A0A9P4MR16_9PLEO|nr:hypothetical protein GQ43DRAFT_464407 [Delitschia confertaspora ATCC 74209]